MKKRILSILLLCCMVLTLLPTTAFAAETGAMDNIPAKFDVEIDLCNRTSDINIKDSKTYYIYSSSSDPDFVWTKKIQINGKKAAPHIFLDNVNIQVKKDAKTPAIELHGKASAYLYFINRDSKLTGATGRAAIQKNRSEGQLCVQVMKGTTVTCQGGYKAAGIGGSWATRNIAESLFNLDMYGHGANMHFGSQTNPSLWSGTIIAKGGDGGAGIGGGRNGSGEKLYFYSGKIEAKGGEAGSGIGGSFKGRGRDIYIYGGDISATGGDGGAGIGGAAGNRCRTWMATPQPIISTFTAARSTPTADTTARASAAVSSSRRAISPSPAARSRRTVRTARPSAADAGVTVRTSP